jgi:hypothetical protein
MVTYINGNGAAIPSVTKVITGAGLAHRHLTKPQRACLAADTYDGLARLTPSQTQLADIFGVSVPYIMAARTLSPERRIAILNGQDTTSFTDLVRPTRQLQLKLPAPNCASITNLQLQHVIRAVGVDRALAAAVAVEHNT